MLFLKRFGILTLLIGFLFILFSFSDEIGRMLYPVKYEHEIIDSSERYHVDPYLIAAIIKVESNFDPASISSSDAFGLMQIIPDTANWIVSMGNFDLDWKDRLDEPEINIEMGAKYLELMSRQFKMMLSGQTEADQNAILAATYNAGAGNVSRWLDEGTWNGSYESRADIPFGETRHYVRRVHYYYGNYKDFYTDKWGEALD